MGRESLLSSRSERKTRKLWCPSLIAAWGCPHSGRTRSSVRFLPPNPTGPAWDFVSAALSSNRMAAACGLPTTPRGAQAFVSPYLPKPRRMNDTHKALAVFAIDEAGAGERAGNLHNRTVHRFSVEMFWIRRYALTRAHLVQLHSSSSLGSFFFGSGLDLSC